MSPSFYALFRRSKYSSVPNTDETDNPEKVQRSHLQTERFAVAAIAFCLKHDELFLKHFLSTVCDDTNTNRSLDILIEETSWGDLVLKAHDNSRVFVVECKIRAKLEKHQDPSHASELFWNVGYGREIIDHYGVHAQLIRYIVLGCAAKLGGLPYVRSNLSCAQKQWADLKLGLPETTLCGDLSSALVALQVKAFRSTNTNNLYRSTDVRKAVETLGMLSDVVEELEFAEASTKTDIVFTSDEDWRFGLIVYTNQSATGPFKLLHDSLLPPNPEISWFGYTKGKMAGTSQPSVWFWCEPSQHTILKERLAKGGVAASRIKSDQDGGWNYLVVYAEADDILAKEGDKEWFKSVFMSVL